MGRGSYLLLILFLTLKPGSDREPERRRALKGSRCRWEDIIKMSLREKKGCKNWIYLAEVGDRWPALANKLISLQIPYYFWK